MGGPASVGGRRLQSTSNFLLAPMKILGVMVNEKGEQTSGELEWKSCEHFLQASKFDAIEGGPPVWAHCRKIQLVPDPLQAWELGQSRAHALRKDWEAVKAHAMYICVRAKYEQHAVYAQTLAATTESIQAGPSTSNWQHLNTIVLERVRYELREQQRLEALVTRDIYEAWCKETNLPSGAAPITIHVATTA